MKNKLNAIEEHGHITNVKWVKATKKSYPHFVVTHMSGHKTLIPSMVNNMNDTLCAIFAAYLQVKK